MGNRRLNNWRWWLQTVSLGLLLVASFAPLSETLHGIVLPVALGGMLAYFATDSPESRMWLLRSLIPFAAFILLAVLFSFGPKLVFFGILGIWAGTTLWEVFKGEHAEYLAQRDRHLRRPESN
jgi:predicted PurR-regulated permease PerM